MSQFWGGGGASLVGISVYNVKDYGAAGNGIANDAPAVQAAINAAIANGSGTVVVPVGTYLIANTVTISAPIRMVGTGALPNQEGVASYFLAANGLNADMFQFKPPANTAVSGAYFENLTFDGNCQNQTAGNVFNAFGAVQCAWYSCHFTRAWGNGLWLNTDGSGNTGHQNRIIACLFDNCNLSPAGDGRGLLFTASDENVVMGCDFESNGRVGAAEPNHLYDRSGLQTIIGNSFVGGQTGVKCEGSSSRIIGNIFDGCQNHHVRLNGDRHIVAHNHMYNIGAGATANTVDGVWVDNIANSVIEGNTFNSFSAGAARSGVNLSSGPPTLTLVAHNNFTVTTGTYGTAAIIIGTGAGNVIEGNSGWNPAGRQTPPTVPASGTVVTNPFPYSCTVYISSGLNITGVLINGVSLNFSGFGSGTFRLHVGDTIEVTYTSPFLWQWYAD